MVEWVLIKLNIIFFLLFINGRRQINWQHDIIKRILRGVNIKKFLIVNEENKRRFGVNRIY